MTTGHNTERDHTGWWGNHTEKGDFVVNSNVLKWKTSTLNVKNTFAQWNEATLLFFVPDFCGNQKNVGCVKLGNSQIRALHTVQNNEDFKLSKAWDNFI